MGKHPSPKEDVDDKNKENDPWFGENHPARPKEDVDDNNKENDPWFGENHPNRPKEDVDDNNKENDPWYGEKHPALQADARTEPDVDESKENDYDNDPWHGEKHPVPAADAQTRAKSDVDEGLANDPWYGGKHAEPKAEVQAAADVKNENQPWFGANNNPKTEMMSVDNNNNYPNDPWYGGKHAENEPNVRKLVASNNHTDDDNTHGEIPELQRSSVARKLGAISDFYHSNSVNNVPEINVALTSGAVNTYNKASSELPEKKCSTWGP